MTKGSLGRAIRSAALSSALLLAALPPVQAASLQAGLPPAGSLPPARPHQEEPQGPLTEPEINDLMARITSELQQALLRHEGRLQQVAREVPPQARPAVEQALRRSMEQRERALARVTANLEGAQANMRRARAHFEAAQEKAQQAQDRGKEATPAGASAGGAATRTPGPPAGTRPAGPPAGDAATRTPGPPAGTPGPGAGSQDPGTERPQGGPAGGGRGRP